MTPAAVLYSLVSRVAFSATLLTSAPFASLLPWLRKARPPSLAVQVSSQQQQDPKELAPSAPSQQQQPQPQHGGEGEEKVAIVTGSNTGIGYETARALVVRHGYTVILACRSRDKAEQAAERINSDESYPPNKRGRAVFVHPLDLTSVESISAFVRAVKDRYGAVHLLVNNAGRNTNGDPADERLGWDLLFQSNFLGHYVLTAKLLDHMINGEDSRKDEKKNQKPTMDGTDAVVLPRIVNLSSVMHHFCGGYDVESPEFWKDVALSAKHPSDTYSLSKLAALLFTIELNKRYSTRSKVQSIAVNPGAVNSDIWRDFPRFLIPIFRSVYLTCQEGCEPVVAAATMRPASLEGESPSSSSTTTSSLPLYVQPYWIPFASSDRTPFPATEMLGPYVGHAITKPRLPRDGGSAAGEALWKACQELTGCEWP